MMKIRCVSVLFLLLSLAQLPAQNTGPFPPSKQYRAQLEEVGPVHEITLRDTIAAALRCNLDIELEGYERESYRANTASANSYYDPIATGNTSLVSTNIPTTSILQTGEFGSQITKTWSVTPGIQENLPGGGTATVTVNLNRVSVNSGFALINPAFGTTIGFVITQPLWRGFRRTGAERQLVIARLNQQIGETQFRQKVSGVVEQVINAYWKLAIAIMNYEVQREGLDVAVAEYEQASKLNQEGQQAASLSSQRTDVASHGQSLTDAAVQAGKASNALKRLVAKSIMDPVWTTGLITSDHPDFQELPVSLDEAVKTAMERSPELQELRLQLKQSEADVRFDKQETKPSVNLRLEAQSNANAGIIVSNNLPVGSIIPSGGGLGTAARQAVEFLHPSLAAGLEIRVPLRNTAAKAQLEMAVIGIRKLETHLRAAQEDILVDIRDAWDSIAARRKNVEAVRLSLQLAEKRLAAEAAKGGTASPSIDLLRGQEDLAEARARELQALVDYQLSVVSLEKAMNTLVDDQQIVVAGQN